MADDYKGMRQTTPQHDDTTAQRERQNPLRDLDGSADEAEKVKGGRRITSDPWEGGEIA